MGNPLGLRKDGKYKAVSTAPSINKTPMGNSTPPVPYPVSADLSNSIGVVPNVRFNGRPAYVFDQSTQPKCTGDNPGRAGGIRSGTCGGEVKPTSSSRHVRIKGKPVVRVGDKCTLNNGNCPGVFVSAPAPSAPEGNMAVDLDGTMRSVDERSISDRLKDFKGNINNRINNWVAGQGYGITASAIGAAGKALNEVFVPENNVDTAIMALGPAGKGLKGLTKLKKLGEAESAAKTAKKAEQATGAAKKVGGTGDGFHVTESIKQRKAKTLKTNKEKGKLREEEVKKELQTEGHDVLGSQVSVKTPETRRVVDHLIQDGGTGEIRAIEVKSGDALRSASQVAKDNAMEKIGGEIIGKNAPSDLLGKTMKISTEVRK